jgi:hypothetical protein
MNTPTSGWMSRVFCPEGYHDPINQGGEDGFTRVGWRDTHGEEVLSVFCAKIQVPIHQFVVDIVRALSSTESSNPFPPLLVVSRLEVPNRTTNDACLKDTRRSRTMTSIQVTEK